MILIKMYPPSFEDGDDMMAQETVASGETHKEALDNLVAALNDDAIDTDGNFLCVMEVPGSVAWDRITVEEYDRPTEVMDRFFAAVAASRHDINSVSLLVLDTKNLKPIAEFKILREVWRETPSGFDLTSTESLRVRAILERRRGGQDCTEEESATLKQWVKRTTLMAGNGSVELDAQIQELFPLEWGEAHEEMEKEFGGYQ